MCTFAGHGTLGIGGAASGGSPDAKFAQPVTAHSVLYKGIMYRWVLSVIIRCQVVKVDEAAGFCCCRARACGLRPHGVEHQQLVGQHAELFILAKAHATTAPVLVACACAYIYVYHLNPCMFGAAWL